MITKIRTNGKMLMNISGEAPTPWAYAGVTNIKKLLDGEIPQGRPRENFGRNIVGKVANATARPGESVAFPAVRRVLERRSRMRLGVGRKIVLQQKLGVGSWCFAMELLLNTAMPQQKT
ncbi:hypothetical protein [Mesorhizobium sp.]|uniref:hypothetical protein n=1 Tax=Mesorhizobium sp. TaxID=1871066 RepID=UPI0025FEF074|nr:hypothetical protein [Mesorhizobium sp.]